jgi:hypothetical protein
MLITSWLAWRTRVIDRLLSRGEPAIGREGPGDVAGKVVVFGAGVDEDKVSVVDLLLVCIVVEDCRVEARADDRGIGRAGGAVAAESILDRRFKLVLVHSGAALTHGGDVAGGGDPCGATKVFDLLWALAQPHFVKDEGWIDDCSRAVDAGADKFAKPAECRDDPLVEAFVKAESIVEGLGISEVAGRIWSSLPNIVSGIGAELAYGALDTGAEAGPDLFLASPWPDKQDVTMCRMRRSDDGDAVRFIQSGQKIEVRILAKLEIGVGIAANLPSTRDDGDASRR